MRYAFLKISGIGSAVLLQQAPGQKSDGASHTTELEVSDEHKIVEMDHAVTGPGVQR
jgi:hypothetical protein